MRFLQRPVLLVDAVDAGVALGALHLAVEAVIVRPVLLRAERRLVDEIRAVADAALAPVFLGQRRVGRRVHPVVDHDSCSHPSGTQMCPASQRQPRIRARRPDLMERHDEMVAADVHLRVAERPDAGVEIAVIGDVDDELRRLAADKRVRRLDPAARRVVGQEPVQDRRVRGVDAAFQRLQLVAFLDDLGDVAAALPALASRRIWAAAASCRPARDRPTRSRPARPSDRR